MTLVAADSFAGRRDENQDNFLILRPATVGGEAIMLTDGEQTVAEVPSWPATHLRIAVADGMGGHDNGRQIAEAAIQRLLAFPPAADPRQLRDIVRAVHDALWEDFHTDADLSPGTTLIVADISLDDGHCVLVSVGDSRAMLMSAGGWVALTRDHTVAEFSYRDGDIDRERYEEILAEGGSNSVTQALGYGSWGIIRNESGRKPNRQSRELRIDLETDLDLDFEEAQAHADAFTFTLVPGCTLVLASDGLWTGEEGKTLSLPPVPELIDEFTPGDLIRNAFDRGSTDNITVAMCRRADDSSGG